MRLLDLFCGAGGASVGYHRAGFEVIGLDVEPHDDYPYELIVADWTTGIDLLATGTFDAVHASPPCPRYSTATATQARDRHPDLVPPVRAALRAWGGSYVIENVPGAPLDNPVTLCGSSFSLGVRRHRLFETTVAVWQPECEHAAQPLVHGVYGMHQDRPGGWLRPNGKSRGLKATSVAHAQELMGIDWMTRWEDLADAIPPAYTQYLGEHLLAELATGVA